MLPPQSRVSGRSYGAGRWLSEAPELSRAWRAQLWPWAGCEGAQARRPLPGAKAAAPSASGPFGTREEDHSGVKFGDPMPLIVPNTPLPTKQVNLRYTGKIFVSQSKHKKII